MARQNEFHEQYGGKINSTNKMGIKCLNHKKWRHSCDRATAHSQLETESFENKPPQINCPQDTSNN